MGCKLLALCYITLLQLSIFVYLYVLFIFVSILRMGLEALVESYAFWRPSLRTLTFEDIPGIAKQGKVEYITSANSKI